MAEEKKLRITQIKSPIGFKYDQRRTLEALGLRKMNATTIKPDNPSVRGMVFKVKHLVKVEEL